jgi:hypothetical protein
VDQCKDRHSGTLLQEGYEQHFVRLQTESQFKFIYVCEG